MKAREQKSGESERRVVVAKTLESRLEFKVKRECRLTES